jgi:hypothetical protein
VIGADGVLEVPLARVQLRPDGASTALLEGDTVILRLTWPRSWDGTVDVLEAHALLRRLYGEAMTEAGRWP